jgi:D-alanyl-D-alanine carboxypeptidase/D-alanyl-D-alanine-endopeptidase (penicillin-binding protein 4)
MAGLLRDTPLAGRLVAKTGTLRGVKAYSGYLPDAGGVDLTFTLMINGDESASCTSTSCPLLDTLARALATYPGGSPAPLSLKPIAAPTGS